MTATKPDAAMIERATRSTCVACRFFIPDVERPPYGSCERWNAGYDTELPTMPLNEVVVENDEGWAMLMGPQFGCVLYEPKLFKATEDQP